MKVKIIFLCGVIVMAQCTLWPARLPAQSREPNQPWHVDLETGAVFSGYNDVRIPGNTGTDLSLTEELQTDARAFYRVRLEYAISTKSSLALLIAPLRVNADGQVDRPVRFEGVTFPANTPLLAKYRFDSYRLTYRYDFHRAEKFHAGIGFTAKIRDASISLEDNARKSEKKNTGFVPLINFRVQWLFAKRFRVLLDGDALAAPQGRAEDVLLAIAYQANNHFALKAGYRLLEGGADNDEVYTFSLFHYIVAGAIITF
ncbi:MAG: hypothetical protein ONB44_13350 [candidate division KSB1 bacterium]|nr:hypothetical protein [candidate division KSB1 bacterium]MDZ7303108.1 hypothetical protein [candidate division KSB1 bacterium]MDZ7312647.1 hypothetical protein [candidate division KSB1 bacterium]